MWQQLTKNFKFMIELLKYVIIGFLFIAVIIIIKKFFNKKEK
jgi:hypothetical protein